MVWLINIPAYICAALAMLRKINNGEYYEAVVFAVLMGVLVAEAFFAQQVLDTELIDRFAIIAQQNLTGFIIPLLYMFHAPSGGEERLNKVTIILFAITLMLFIPATAINIEPLHGRIRYITPPYDLGLTVFYQSKYIYYVPWIAFVLLLQTLVALHQVRKVARLVKTYGAHYSNTTKGVLIWDFSCGFFLSVFFFIPLSFWQQPAMRLVFFVASSVIIAVGSLLILFGFDLNPVADTEGKRFSMKEFVVENGALIQHFQHLVEDEKIYLDRGIQAETVVKKLHTNHIYFERMVQAEYGCSFPEFVHRRRVTYAQKLRSTTDKTADAIALECGYNDTPTFLALYERITGEKFN